jgi:hypothetical protein
MKAARRRAAFFFTWRRPADRGKVSIPVSLPYRKPLARRRKSPSRGKAQKPHAAAVELKTPAPESKPATPSRARRHLVIDLAVAAAMVVLAAGLIWKFTVCCKAPGTSDIAQENLAHADLAHADLTFVGSETCISCHQEEGRLWHTSQHAHAMAHATANTVLGDFNDASFDYYGVKSRFFKKDGKFYVETDGPDGKLAPFEVKYTFGVYPLQQYLVEFPDGRIQALSLAWDTRPKAQGGQRWFHLYPDENITHDDPLHWTKLNQNWNFMCAECHSTGIAKNYDAAKDSFATTWKEISVGCEACHGQGSAHVAWAKRGAPSGDKDKMMGLLARFDERSGVTWSRDPKTGQPAPRRPLCAKRLKCAGAAMRAAARSRKTGCRDGRSPTPMSCRCSPTDFIRPTARCWTRSTITDRSSRARCSRRASPAATATIRTVPSCAHQATRSACSAMPRAMHKPLTPTMKV